jgi:hypothetical protein
MSPCDCLYDKTLWAQRPAPAAAPSDGIATHRHNSNMLLLT